MTLKEIDEQEFSSFAISHPLFTFHQTKEWANLKGKNGWGHCYVGLYDDKKLVGASLLLFKSTPIKKKMFYAPRGFLIDFDNMEIVKEFTKGIKDFVKKRQGIFIKIDPVIPYQERDVNGKVVNENINRDELIHNLKSLGYRHYGLNINSHKELQPRWVFVLPIEGKSTEDIYSKFDSRTKRSIKKCQNNGVIVEQLKEKDLQVFKSIMEHTSKRRGFLDRPVTYYHNMIDILNDHCKIYISYLDTNKAIELLTNSINEEEKRILQFEKTKESDKSKQGIIKSQELITNLHNEIDKIGILQKEKGNKIPLGGALFIQYGKERTYIFGGSYKEYMNYPSQYLIQWTSIMDAVNDGCNIYNFYGIDGNLDKDGEMHGVYEFKRGFDGEVREYIGEFDLITSKFYYAVYKIAFKMYKLLKRVKIGNKEE